MVEITAEDFGLPEQENYWHVDYQFYGGLELNFEPESAINTVDSSYCYLSDCTSGSHTIEYIYYEPTYWYTND